MWHLGNSFKNGRKIDLFTIFIVVAVAIIVNMDALFMLIRVYIVRKISVVRSILGSTRFIERS